MNFLLYTFSDWRRPAIRKMALWFGVGFFSAFGPQVVWKIWKVERPAIIRLADESLVQVQGTKVLVHLDLDHRRNFCQGALVIRLLVHYPEGIVPSHTNFDYAEQVDQTEPYINVPGIYHFTAIMSIKEPLPSLPGKWAFIGSSYNGCTLLGKLGADTALVSKLVPVRVENGKD